MKAFDRDDDIVELQRAAGAGDEDAWRALVDRFSPLVLSVTNAHRLNHADAQDIQQYVWLTLIQHLGRIKEPARLGAWLYIVTKHECLRALGGAGRQILTDRVTETEALDNSDDADTSLVLERLLAQLSPRSRQVIVAHYLKDTPTEKVAADLGISTSTVETYLKRGRQRLRGLLTQSQPQEEVCP